MSTDSCESDEIYYEEQKKIIYIHISTKKNKDEEQV